MRTTTTMTISLPPGMVDEFEKIRKAENRTRSELVREALRTYFSLRHGSTTATATRVELAAIGQGRAQIKQGQLVSLDELLHAVEAASRKKSRKGTAKGSRQR